MITLDLPWPPSANNLFPTLRGRRVMSERGRIYVGKFKVAVRKQLPKHVTFLGRMCYRVRFSPPDRRRRDLSNLLKAVEDCLTKCDVWGDDSQVDNGQFLRGPVVKGGRVEIEIWDEEDQSNRVQRRDDVISAARSLCYSASIDATSFSRAVSAKTAGISDRLADCLLKYDE